jgi:hypothetical protein
MLQAISDPIFVLRIDLFHHTGLDLNLSLQERYRIRP